MHNRISEISKILIPHPNNNSIKKIELFRKFDESSFPKGNFSLKWEIERKKSPEKPYYFPLWLADMDYPVADCIQSALQNVVSSSNFGYTNTSEAYYQSIINWHWNNYKVLFKKEEIYRYSQKTLVGIGLIIQAFSEKNDAVIVLSPVYNMFYENILMNERKLVESHMIYKDRTFLIDFVDFEEKIILNKPKIFIFCNPHNPIGRVFKKEEIYKLHEICLRFNVIFVSDDVFSEIVFEENKYIQPFMSPFENNTILVTSIGKNFNINGLDTGYCVIKNKKLREKFSTAAQKISLDDSFGNIFSHIATIAAYSNEGKFWLDCVREYIYENYKMMVKYFEENLNEIVPVKLEGSFVLLCDYSKLGISESVFLKKCEEENIIFSKGSSYHVPTKMFRINIACSKKFLKEVLEKLKEIFRK